MAKTPPIPVEIHHTITLQLDDGQKTLKGEALVALADASDSVVRALVDVLAERAGARFVEHENELVASLEPLGRLVDEAAFSAYGRMDDEYHDRRSWPRIRPEMVHAAAVLLSAITLIDDAAAAAEGGKH